MFLVILLTDRLIDRKKDRKQRNEIEESSHGHGGVDFEALDGFLHFFYTYIIYRDDVTYKGKGKGKNSRVFYCVIILCVTRNYLFCITHSNVMNCILEEYSSVKYHKTWCLFGEIFWVEVMNLQSGFMSLQSWTCSSLVRILRSLCWRD